MFTAKVQLPVNAGLNESTHSGNPLTKLICFLPPVIKRLLKVNGESCICKFVHGFVCIVLNMTSGLYFLITRKTNAAKIENNANMGELSNVAAYRRHWFTNLLLGKENNETQSE